MLNYIYDGSFEGLLTAVFEAKYRHQIPDDIVTKVSTQQSFFQESLHVTTNSEKAARVQKAIKEKLSPTSLTNVYNAFLSEVENSGRWIHHYLEFGWSVGKKLDLYLTDERVLKIHNISRKVGAECHRMYGLVRFSEIAPGIYYSSVELDFNILTLIAPHFSERFSNQNWIIHDIKRDLAIVYNKEEWFLTTLQPRQLAAFSQIECDYQALWKQYFKSISISSRVNPKLQRKSMPVRYWKHLIEK